MSWFIRILTPGPAAQFATSSLSEHLYVYEEETPSGHSYFYLGSPHLDMLTDHVRAIYRARSLITVFKSVQRLSYASIWEYDESSIYSRNRSFDLTLQDENIALEEVSNPFQSSDLSGDTYGNRYHFFLDLAAKDSLVYNVFLLLDDAFRYTRYFYINLYKIVETIENDWTKNEMSQYSSAAKLAFDYLNKGNIRGYMNQFMASGLFSRHGFTNSKPAASTIVSPPPIHEIKDNLLILINEWLSYKMIKTQAI